MPTSKFDYFLHDSPQFGNDTTLTIDSTRALLAKSDHIVGAIGYEPSHFNRSILTDNLTHVVIYWPANWDNVDGQIQVALGRTDWAILRITRSETLFVRDTTLTTVELRAILDITDSVVQATMQSDHQYECRLLADDSSYAVYYSPKQDTAAGTWILGGCCQVILRKEDRSVAGVKRMQ